MNIEEKLKNESKKSFTIMNDIREKNNTAPTKKKSHVKCQKCRVKFEKSIMIEVERKNKNCYYYYCDPCNDERLGYVK